ncbi:MAG TPA: hypothetical protein VGK24_19665, partial [Candidatus Angelobacter sp.]
MATATVQGFYLSAQQKQVWQAQRESRVQPSQCVLSLEGTLDVPRLRAAVERLVRRYEVLRTDFVCLPGMALPLQVILAEG